MSDETIAERDKAVDGFVKDKSWDVVSNGLVTSQTTEDYSKNLYQMPLPESKLEGFGVAISPAHQGNLVNSIDFFVPFATEVYAAAAGRITKVKKDSNIGGPDIKYWAQGNYIEIKHENGEYTWYEHLKFEGVVVAIGQDVAVGQLIGYSGSTGFSVTPHLHFQVNRYFGSGENDYVTLRARFANFEDLYGTDKKNTNEVKILDPKNLKK
jgi:murein DD-endopeptidase MepM/ murein hydrolase activator NlpD